VSSGTSTFDPVNGYVYVGDSLSALVSVLDNHSLLTNIGEGALPGEFVGAGDMAIDQRTGWVYASDGASLSVFEGTSSPTAISLGDGLPSVTYSPGDGCVFATMATASRVAVVCGDRLLGTVGAGSFPIDAAYDDSNGYLYACNFDSNNLSAISTWPTVTFRESGLPSMLAWGVSIDGRPVVTSNSSSLTTDAPIGTHAYRIVVPSNSSWIATGGTFDVANYTGRLVSVRFQPTYAVGFSESGLPTGTAWSVTFDGIAKNGTGDLSFAGILNGTYGFTVGSLVNPGFGGYVPTPSAGSLSVKGQAASESIVFTLASSGPPSSGSTFLGLPALEGYAVLGGVIVALAAVTVVALLRSRRGKAPPARAERVADPPAYP
jgi:DNA-binding beta-propeller fold protein YncE